MRVVLDTNVLVSGLNRRTTGAPAIVINRWLEGAFDLFMSQHIIDGVERAWRKPYYLRFFDDREIGSLLAQLAFAGTMVTPAGDVHGVAEDEEDDLVLATAVAAGADYLVTGDRYLLEIGEFRGIPIVSPRAFLDALADDES